MGRLILLLFLFTKLINSSFASQDELLNGDDIKDFHTYLKSTLDNLKTNIKELFDGKTKGGNDAELSKVNMCILGSLCIRKDTRDKSQRYLLKCGNEISVASATSIKQWKGKPRGITVLAWPTCKEYGVFPKSKEDVVMSFYYGYSHTFKEWLEFVPGDQKLDVEKALNDYKVGILKANSDENLLKLRSMGLATLFNEKDFFISRSKIRKESVSSYFSSDDWMNEPIGCLPSSIKDSLVTALYPSAENIYTSFLGLEENIGYDKLMQHLNTLKQYYGEEKNGHSESLLAWFYKMQLQEKENLLNKGIEHFNGGITTNDLFPILFLYSERSTCEPCEKISAENFSEILLIAFSRKYKKGLDTFSEIKDISWKSETLEALNEATEVITDPKKELTDVGIKRIPFQYSLEKNGGAS